jgi:hypothetical protein
MPKMQIGRPFIKAPQMGKWKKILGK